MIASTGTTRVLFVKFQNFRRKLTDKDAARLSELSKEGKHKDIFNLIYENRYWKTDESVSGWGSSMEITKVLRPKLEKLLRDLAVKSFLDVPCGDFNWMKAVDFGATKYIGGDIVAPLVNDLTAKYGSSDRSFIVLDLISDRLPDVDMIFIRDCLIHLENDLVMKALTNIANSSIKYAVITHAPFISTNMNIDTGHFRNINLTKPPFSLPKPMQILDEGCKDPLSFDKSLGVWSVEDIKAVLTK